MKLDLNFVDYPVGKIRLLGVGLVAINILSVGAAIYIWFDRQSLQQSNVEMTIRRDELMEKYAGMQASASQLPEKNELIHLRDEIGRLNVILKNHQYDTNGALELIEKTIPEYVFLTHYKHDSESGEILLKAVARKPARLTAFLKNLEKDSAFKHVLLLRQDSVSQGKTPMHRFEIKISQAAG